MSIHDILRTFRGKEATRDAAVGDHIPWARPIDEHTIETHDGALFQTIRLDGFAFETATQSVLNSLARTMNTFLLSMAISRHALVHHIVRRAATPYPGGELDGFAGLIDRRYKEHLATRRTYVNDQYITVVRRPLQGKIGLTERAFRVLQSSTDRRAFEEAQSVAGKALNEKVGHLIASLGPYGPKLLSEYSTPEGTASTLLEFMGFLVNQETRPVLVPHMGLNRYLPTKRISFGPEAIELRGAKQDDRAFCAIVSIKEYGVESYAGMLNSLMRLPHEFLLTQTFAFIDREPALGELARIQRVMGTSEDAAVDQAQELSSAASATAGGSIAWGEHHMTVCVKAASFEELDAAVTGVTRELTKIGVIAVREDLNLEAAYWAQLPGNFRYIARSASISTNNFVGFASLHGFPSGKLEGNHWGPCVTVLETTSGTPYAFNFHHGDLGNFIVTGPSGSGKTVFLGFVLACAGRFNPRAVFFDRNRGAELILRALGAHYAIITPGVPTGFNPLQLEDSPANREFLRGWLAQIVSPAGASIGEEDRRTIGVAVDHNFLVPRHQRRLSILSDLFKGRRTENAESLASRLAPWHGGGPHAWLFDNDDDRLTLDHCITGFDLTHILDDTRKCSPALMYLFHRVEQRLNSLEKTIIFIDEGWQVLGEPVFEERLDGWLRTIRKHNGIVGFGSQSASDALSSRIGNSIIDQSPTQVFMPNPKARRADYCDGFKLTYREYEVVKNLSPESRCFLVKHGSHSVIARLDLTGMDDLLAILSARSETLHLADVIRSELGDDPKVWLPEFFNRLRR